LTVLKTRSAANGLETRHQAEEIAAAFPPLMIEAERIAQTVAAGLHGRRRAGPGETFWQHRAYAFGDPVSAIDWRQSARVSDRLYVRQNEWDAAAAVWIWRDPSRSLEYASSRNLPTKRRRADILALALASLLARGGERIGVISSNPQIFHGRNAAARYYEALDITGFDERASSPPPYPLGAHARVVFFSDFFTDIDAIGASAARAAALGAKGVFLQINDPAEESFPFKGRTEFSNPESRDRVTFGDAGALREDYIREFAAHRATLMQLCNRFNWTFIAHRTDAPANNALLALFAAVADQRSRS
jgi:uncharacterized protein (DUF58 family)